MMDLDQLMECARRGDLEAVQKQSREWANLMIDNLKMQLHKPYDSKNERQFNI